MFIKSGWLEGTRIATGRFREEQSKINWVRISWVGVHISLLFGNLLATVLSRSGSILHLVSAVALHLVRMCSKSSAGVG